MARTTSERDAGAGRGICPGRVGQLAHREVGSPAVASILIVEDEPLLGRQLARSLEAAGHDVRLAPTAAEGLAAVREDPPDLALLDLRLPDRSGLDVLADLQGEARDVSVVLMTAYGSVRDAVEAMRRGAADYLQKPLDLDELGLTVQRVLSRQREVRELSWLRSRERGLPHGVIGADPRLLAIFRQVERLREAGLPPGRRPAILLTGETGTGKGVVARAIHASLGDGPFLEVNCTAMPASMIEAELFGHERGSFTDAKASRTGLFEAADGGTLFLDEIGDLEVGLQAKFLKAIEEKRIRRLGSTRDRAVDVHVVAATNRDLDAAVASGGFRADLLHRLRVLSFEIPPLRERPADVALLARHFAGELGQLYGGRPRRLAPAAEALLAGYAWPGNVRELRNVMERVVLLHSDEELGPEPFAELLRPAAAAAAARAAGPAAAPASAPLPDDAAASDAFALPEGGVDLERIERRLIAQALERTGGNRTRAAALLGMSRDTLRYRIEKFGIE
jgi:DNA-binding NtrC family response regulator